MSLHYPVNQQDRICVVTRGAEIPRDEDISTSPRMIAFIDVSPGANFLPQAAELNDGRVVTFFTPLIEELRQDGDTLPAAYPENTMTDDGRRERDAHRKWMPTTGTSTRQSRSWRRSSATVAGPVD